jgi:hypothetical protein
MRATTKEPGRAAVPTPAVAIEAAAIEADLAALAQEEQNLHRRREERRQQYWNVAIASATRTIDQLASFGFDRSDIAKALGLASGGKAATPKKGTGPKTHAGWHALFLATGVRSYLKAHQDLAAKLKADQVSSDQYSSHIPPEDLKVIEDAARKRADAKCPASARPSEVSSR